MLIVRACQRQFSLAGAATSDGCGRPRRVLRRDIMVFVTIRTALHIDIRSVGVADVVLGFLAKYVLKIVERPGNVVSIDLCNV